MCNIKMYQFVTYINCINNVTNVSLIPVCIHVTFNCYKLIVIHKIRRALAIITVLAGIGVSGWAITGMMTGQLIFQPMLYVLCVLNVMAGVLLVIFDAS